MQVQKLRTSIHRWRHAKTLPLRLALMDSFGPVGGPSGDSSNDKGLCECQIPIPRSATNPEMGLVLRQC